MARKELLLSTDVLETRLLQKY